MYNMAKSLKTDMSEPKKNTKSKFYNHERTKS